MNLPDLTTLLFYVLAILTGLCALGVVVTQNIVRAAAWLLFALGGVGGIFFFLGADFVGATQLIVYVGGTLVLVVFGVMLTAQGPFINLRASAAEWALSIVVGLSLFGVLAVTVALANWDRSAGPDKAKGAMTLVQANDPDSSPNSTLIGHDFLNQPVGPNRTSALLPFEIVSVHLLVVLVGAAYLARASAAEEPPPMLPMFAESSGLPEVGLTHYLVLGALLFVCGVVCMATKRNAIGILMGVELVLNGANVNFVAFAAHSPDPAFQVEGQVFALFVIVLAAAEAAVALAIVLNFYNNHMTVDVDTAEELKG